MSDIVKNLIYKLKDLFMKNIFPSKINNIRQQQAYSALCLAQFCKHYNVRDESVFELIKYLLNILISDDLPQWLEDGCEVELSVQGNPAGKEIIEAFPQSVQLCAEDLFDYVSHVGALDMYGALTDRPYECLCQSIRILEVNQVNLPNTDYFESETNPGWGEQITKDDYLVFLQTYNVLLSDITKDNAK